MPVFFQVQVKTVTVDRRRLLRLTESVLALAGEASADVGLSLIGDRRMRSLNRRFRGKDRRTDVLAFAMRDARMGRVPGPVFKALGDVVISVPTAWRQAKAANRSLDEEITSLLIHGVLHLCGLDHERSRAEALRMQRKAEWIQKRLGRIPCFVRQPY